MKGMRSRDVFERPAMMKVRSEYLDRVYQCLPYTPSERNADECPEQQRLRVKPTKPDSERARGSRIDRCCPCLKSGDIRFLHEPFVGDRTDQKIADESDHQQSGEDIHRVVVDQRAPDARGELRIAKVADEQ